MATISDPAKIALARAGWCVRCTNHKAEPPAAHCRNCREYFKDYYKRNRQKWVERYWK